MSMNFGYLNQFLEYLNKIQILKEMEKDFPASRLNLAQEPGLRRPMTHDARMA
jgi:hypothetical protein